MLLKKIALNNNFDKFYTKVNTFYKFPMEYLKFIFGKYSLFFNKKNQLELKEIENTIGKYCIQFQTLNKSNELIKFINNKILITTNHNDLFNIILIDLVNKNCFTRSFDMPYLDQGTIDILFDFHEYTSTELRLISEMLQKISNNIAIVSGDNIILDDKFHSYLEKTQNNSRSLLNLYIIDILLKIPDLEKSPNLIKYLQKISKQDSLYIKVKNAYFKEKEQFFNNTHQEIPFPLAKYLRPLQSFFYIGGSLRSKENIKNIQKALKNYSFVFRNRPNLNEIVDLTPDQKVMIMKKHDDHIMLYKINLNSNHIHEEILPQNISNIIDHLKNTMHSPNDINTIQNMFNRIIFSEIDYEIDPAKKTKKVYLDLNFYKYITSLGRIDQETKNKLINMFFFKSIINIPGLSNLFNDININNSLQSTYNEILQDYSIYNNID